MRLFAHASDQRLIISRLLTVFGLVMVMYGSWILLNHNIYFVRLRAGFSQSSNVYGEIPPQSLLEVSIPSIGIEQDAFPGKINNGKWEISDSNVNHMSGSAMPGQSGNIVLYGHNHYTIFGNIRYLKAGDLIELRDRYGKVFSYKVTKLYEVEESDLSPILPTDYEVLTMYTCTDLLGTKRVIVQALPSHR